MRKRLLSIFSFALTAVAANAQSWSQPSLSLVTDAVPEKAYIYNVKQGKFLTKGGAWGNHACIKEDVSVAFLYEMQDQGEGVFKLYCASADKQHLLGRESAEDVYTDFNNQATWSTLWEFTSTEGGFNILTAHSCPNFGSDKYTDDDPVNYGTYLLGWSPEREDLTNGNGAPMGTYDGIYMVDPATKEGWSCTWAFMTPEKYDVYNAQCSLYNKLNEAFGMGYTEAELSSYAGVLTSTDVEAINAAGAKVDELILNYAYNHATPENPFEVTSKIVNPTFEGARSSEPSGWVDEYSNMLIQNNKAYPIWDDETDAESSEYGLNNFSQNWTSDASITASNIYQVISDLPQGTYILRADAIATTGTADTPVSGCELYAESGAAHYAAEVANVYGASGSSNPRRYELLITHMGGDLKIGYGFTPGHVKWFAVDNFRLFYAGPVDNPGMVALSSATEAAQPYVDNYAEEAKYYYSEATKDALDSELKKADGLTASEDCLAAAGAINDIMKTVKAEVSAYAQLVKFVEQVGGDMDKYSFIAELGDKYDEYKGAYEDKTASAEQVTSWISGYTDFVKAGIKAAIPTASESNPIELTALFDNLGFEQNTTESASPANWTCNSDNFKARANTAEVWNVSFDAYTSLADLPAGAYRITAHGLSRSGGNTDNYAAEGANVSAELYANNAAVKLVSQHVGASATQLYSNDVNLTGDDENPLWAPNSMEGARVYFNVAETPYVNTITANLLKDGDPLRIGFRDNGIDGTVPADSWTIWSDVRVYYIGINSNALYEEMCGVAKTAEGYIDNSQVEQAITKLQDAVSAAEKLSASSSAEEVKAAISTLNDAIEYYNNGKALVQQIMGLQSEYEAIITDYDVEGSDLVKIVDDMSAAVASEQFSSNEQMEGWLNALPAARTAHVFAYALNESGVTPSEEKPVDVTEVMSNASFEKNNADGWTVSNTGGTVGGQEAQRNGSTAYETWNSTSFDIHRTVVGLPAGTYMLTVKALFRNGNNSDELAAEYYANPEAVKAMAQFYANDKSVNVKSIYEDAQTTKPEIDGESSYKYDGQEYFTPNTMISFEKYAVEENDLYTNTIVIYLDGKTDLTLGLRYETTASYAWFPFDEFKLLYMGTEAPAAVEGVEVATEAAKAIYDLSGRKVSKAVKGIYIVDGKKVIK